MLCSGHEIESLKINKWLKYIKIFTLMEIILVYSRLLSNFGFLQKKKLQWIISKNWKVC